MRYNYCECEQCERLSMTVDVNGNMATLSCSSCNFKRTHDFVKEGPIAAARKKNGNIKGFYIGPVKRMGF